MEFSLNPGAATVIITAITAISTIIVKKTSKPDSSKSFEKFMEAMKPLLISQNDLMSRQTTTLSLISQKVNGTHDKVNFMSQVFVGIDKQLVQIEDETKLIPEMNHNMKELRRERG